MARFKMVYKHPNTLIPYEKNSKIHTQEQIERLGESINNFNFDVPIVVDENLVIIKGHGRQAAALQEGLKAVPVIVRTDLSDAQVRAARIADNKLAESEWDLETLVEELEEIAELKEFDGDIDLTGFDKYELEEMHKELEYDPAEGSVRTTKEVAFVRKCQIIIDCKNEKEQQKMYDRLNKEGYVCRVLNI